MTLYGSLREEALELTRDGHFEAAVKVLDKALDTAREIGCEILIGLATVNRARVAIELAPSTELVKQLGQLLLQSSDPETKVRTALSLARAYHLRKDTKKSLFYGRIARQHAEGLDQPEFVAMAHNEIGLSFLAASYFSEAVEEFEQALALLAEGGSQRRAPILDNLGYCYIILGRRKDGFEALFESLRCLRRLDQAWAAMNTMISLSFAHLEHGRPRSAIRHGEAALAIADRTDDPAAVKSSLFLLGEATKQAGDDASARHFFDRLQEKFYPEAPYLAEMLMLIDARTMVNLKA